MSERTQTRKRPTREQKRAANRARILAAARAVFGARGYHGATIEEIADEAGLSNGAIYYNFANKEELFLALLDKRVEERLEHLRTTFAAIGDAGARALADEGRDVTRSFKESREWRLLTLEFIAYAARSPQFAERLAEQKRTLNATVAELLKANLGAAGVEPPLPLDRLALALVGLANGLAVEELSDPGSVPDELLGEVMSMILTGRRT